MPGNSEHPVTLGDLFFNRSNLIVNGKPVPGPYRPATVVDLVSALRAEGVLVVEKVDGEWSDSTLLAFDTAAHALVETRHGSEDLRMAFDVFVAAILDALAEAQPFPPAGE